MLVATPASAATATAAFSKTSTWDTGYQGQYKVTNTGSSTLSGWTVEFDLPSGTTVGSYWDALLTTGPGNHYTFKNREYNGSLAPGASTTFGWVSTGTGTPTGCKLNGGSCEGGTGGPDTTPPSVPGSVTVGSPTNSTLTVTWSASTDNSGSVAGYEVSRDGGSPVPVTGTSYTATGLQEGTAYSFKVRAKDAAGNTSAYSASASGTTTTGTPTPSPGAVRTAPYVDMGSWPTPSLPTMASASGLKSFTMAFITASGCKAMWFNAYDPRAGWAKDQVDAIRAAGGDVKVSFGGASGIELAQACSTVDATAAEYNAVVKAYGLKYIDLDIEGSAAAEPASIARRSAALAKVQQANPGLRISFTLPVLPEGLTSDGLNVVKSARDAGVTVDVVNIMAMDYYRSVDYGDAAVQAANSTFGQLKGLYPGKSDAQVWAMVGVTPMLGQNDDGRIYDQADARQLVAFAKGKHVGLLAFWEETRDRNACNGALYMCTNIPQAPYEFSKIFAGYSG
ncbi:hypothetical protein GCM10012280_57340 [Wenjunlia tyrosinilytica]|uniref:Chitinase n=2 Tax=Wenjunlia tyrosinilytica TaxID=1544741 RepID=A0A917ZX19_9ACTN|nr:hypothetical protein GCM10012280_57340 [Wenjunlia tyrosinilytica]